MSTGFAIGPTEEPDEIRLGPAVASGSEGVLYHGTLETGAGEIPIAVKMLNPGHLGELPAWTARWEAQAQLLRRVRLPGLVGVRAAFIGPLPHQPGDADPTTASLYLVMDWVEGVSLDRWVRSVPQAEPEQLLSTLVPVAAALDLLHSGAATGGVPVVHRDVKPANIIMRPGGDTVLVDLGSVRGLSDDPRHSGVVGTPGYIAPEMRLSGEYGPAADRYALGAVAFFLLTRNEPPIEANHEQLCHLLARTPLLTDREDVVDHVAAMLEPEPQRRPEGLANWVAQLRRSSLAVLPGDVAIPPVAAHRNPPPPTPPRPRPRPRRRSSPRRWVLAGAAVLAVGGALFVALRPDSSPAGRSAAVALPDFKNMTYPAGACGPNSQSFEIRNGARPLADSVNDYPKVSVVQVAEAELTGGTPTEVAVLLQCAYAMTDHGTEATVWAVREGRYQLVASVPTVGAREFAAGDDYTSAVVHLSTRTRRLVATEAVYERQDANCCPSTMLESTYSMSGSTLSLEGSRRLLPHSANEVRSCGSDSNVPCPVYPYISLLNGAIHHFDVSAIATKDVVRKLATLRLGRETLAVRTCRVVNSNAGTAQECVVDATAGDAVSTLTLTAHEATMDESKLDPVDAAGKPVTTQRPWIVTGLRVG